MEDKFTTSRRLQGTYTFLFESADELKREYARHHRYYHNLDHIQDAKDYLEKNILRFAKEYYPKFIPVIEKYGELIVDLLTLKTQRSIEEQIQLKLGRPVETDELVELANVCTSVVYLHVKIIIAIYFHDSVYYSDVIANRLNEQRSAQLFLTKAQAKLKDWASRGLEGQFMTEEEILEIYNAILETKNYTLSKYGLNPPAFNLILEDCDLSIFEQESSDYLSEKLQNYESLIRLEYGHFSDEAYYVKRVWFLINLYDAQAKMIRRNGISALISHILENASCVFMGSPNSPGSYVDQWSSCIEAWRYRQL